jgi:hypothetical protein
MAAATDLLTLAEAKARLGITDTGSDTNIAAVISAVSGQLDELCGPVVNRTVTAELHDGGSTIIALNKPPVASVTSVTEYTGTTATALTEQTIGTAPANGFTCSTGGIVRRLSSGTPRRFPAGSRNVTVTYAAGRYANTAAVAPKFKEAAAMTFRNIWVSELASGSQTFGGVTDGFANPLLGPGLLNKVVALLDGEMARPQA